MDQKAGSEPAVYSKPSKRVHIADIPLDDRAKPNGSSAGQPPSVKILGTVLEKKIFRSKGKIDYGVITVDDGSGSVIQVKTWGKDSKLVEHLEQGDMVDVVGKVKYKDGKAYIVPTIVREVDDPNWETVRELEIIRDHLKRNKIGLTATPLPRQRPVHLESEVLEIVENADRTTGILYVDLVKRIEHSSEDEIKKALIELLKQGKIYESRPGRYNK